MITDSIKMKKEGAPFRKTFQTALIPQAKEVLIGSIPISTYFGNDIKTFNDQYKDRTNVNLNIDIKIKDTTIGITRIEKRYLSDGLPITSRPMKFEDTVNIYAIILIPVMHEKSADEESREFFKLDMNPTPGHKYGSSSDGFNSFIPLDNENDHLGVERRDSRELLAKMIHLYAVPTSIRKVSENEGMDGKVIDGTQNDRALFHTDQGDYFEENSGKYDPSLLRIAKMGLQNPRKLAEDTIVLDTRSRGGGIKNDITKKQIGKIDKSSLSNWDIGYFDGEAYQENGIVVVRVSDRILKEAESEEAARMEVEKAIAKYKAFGVYPIVEYYSEKETHEKMLLENYEFMYNKHINYHQPSLSKGEYVIAFMQIGSQDNYVLQLKGDAVYGIRVPGYHFTESTYELHIKSLKEVTASNRSAATIIVSYQDGTKETIVMGAIEQSQWMIQKQDIVLNKPVQDMKILVNEDASTPTGNVLIDYVLLKPKGITNKEFHETHQI